MEPSPHAKPRPVSPSVLKRRTASTAQWCAGRKGDAKSGAEVWAADRLASAASKTIAMEELRNTRHTVGMSDDRGGKGGGDGWSTRVVPPERLSVSTSSTGKLELSEILPAPRTRAKRIARC